MTELAAIPDSLIETRLALHRLAVSVVSPARRIATGNEIALAPTEGGFGTPAGEGWGQVRVAGDRLVVRSGDGAERSEPITTLRAAARLAGIEVEIDAPLSIDLPSAELLAVFYALFGDALETLRSELADASPVRLWPEHFDVAIDGKGSTYGASPGDEAHPEPYLYVSLWSGAPDDPFFDETAFAGASLGYDELRAAPDPRERALAFWREAIRRT